jgi:hypothetical protein
MARIRSATYPRGERTEPPQRNFSLNKRPLAHDKLDRAGLAALSPARLDMRIAPRVDAAMWPADTRMFLIGVTP